MADDAANRDVSTSDTTRTETPKEEKAKTFPCDQCGADLQFDIGVQSQKCPYCGFVKAIELPDAEIQEQDYESMLERLARLKDGDKGNQPGDHELHCASCGATIVFQGTLTSSECPYCGTPTQRENVHAATTRIPVDGQLPFLVSHDRAAQALKDWVSSRWFAPNEFKKRGVRGKFSGVYLPFFTYDANSYTRYHGERGEHYWVEVGEGKDKRRERRTRWYPASGDFDRFFDDNLILAARGLNRNLMHALEPWPLDRLVPFNQQMISGFLARTYDIALSAGFQEARDRMDAALAADVRRRIGGDEQRVHALQTRYSDVTFKHVLLPAWLLTYRFHDKPYQVFVNATTGEVQGERPWSWIKITLFVLMILAILGVLALAGGMMQK